MSLFRPTNCFFVVVFLIETVGICHGSIKQGYLYYKSSVIVVRTLLTNFASHGSISPLPSIQLGKRNIDSLHR